MADGATGATGPVGPAGLTGATGATGAGTAQMPPPANPWMPHLNDGLHPESSPYVGYGYFKFDIEPVQFTTVDTHVHHPPVLEAIVMLVALVMLLKAGTAAIHQAVAMLLRLRFS